MLEFLKKILLVVAVCIPSQVFAGSPLDNQHVTRYIISNDKGGFVSEYKDALARIEKMDLPIKLDGICKSACTLILSEKYKINTCVTKNATIEIHEPFMVQGFLTVLTVTAIADAKTAWYEDFYNIYPQWVKNLIDKNGGVPSVNTGAKRSEAFVIKYDVLKNYMPTC